MRNVRGAAGIIATSLVTAVTLAALAIGATDNMALNGPASATANISAIAPNSAVSVPPTQQLTSAGKPTVVARPVLAHMPSPYYRVRSGDTLSSIARSKYGKAADWPMIYWANKNTIKYANVIYVGQNLRIPSTYRFKPVPAYAMAPAAPVVTVVASVQSNHDTRQPQETSTNYAVTTSFQSCVISRESGGNAQVVNSTDHYGLYQFSASTWAEYGGDPAEFGDASPAEQTRVFDNAIATPGGADNWAPYDGC